MTVRQSRRFLISLAALPVHPRAASALTISRQSLVVGNGACRSVPALANPPRDAAVLAGVLTRLGFTVQLVLPGASSALVGPQPMRDSLAQWDYPSWFHRFNGALQIVAGVLIAYEPTRVVGLLLGVVICIAVVGTLLRHHEAGISRRC